MRASFIIIISIFIFGCSSRPKQEDFNFDIKPALDSLPSINDMNSNASLGVTFDNKKPFQILSQMYVSPPLKIDDTSGCKDWMLSENELKIIIQNSEPIERFVWEWNYNNLQCSIAGRLFQNFQMFEYVVNAGGSTRVFCRDSTLIFGDRNRADKKYFLSFPTDY